ncbi:hypothetical protein HZS_2584, partial [Henneguya salminicola]
MDAEIEQIQVQEQIEKSSKLNAIIFSLNWLAFGYALAFSSSGQFIYVNTNMMTRYQAGIYGSVLALGALFGNLFCGLFLKKCIGYKYCVILSTILSAIGWYMHLFVLPLNIYRARDMFIILIMARILIGIGCGISANCVPVCVTNTVSVQHRHLIGVFPPLAMNFGYLTSFFFCYLFIKLDTLSNPFEKNIPSIQKDMFYFKNSLAYAPLVGMALNLLGLVCSLIFPDTARNNSSYDPLIEDGTSFISLIREKFEELKKLYIQKQLLTGLGIMFLQQAIGINVIIFNAKTIFYNYFQDKNYDISFSSLVCVLIGVIYLIGSFITILVSKYFKRNDVFMISSFLISSIHLTLAFLYYFNRATSIAVPIITLLFVLIFCSTWTTFPWLVISEIFSLNIRTFGITLATS